jgi:hypothetical protein
MTPERLAQIEETALSMSGYGEVIVSGMLSELLAEVKRPQPEVTNSLSNQINELKAENAKLLETIDRYELSSEAIRDRLS